MISSAPHQRFISLTILAIFVTFVLFFEFRDIQITSFLPKSTSLLPSFNSNHETPSLETSSTLSSHIQPPATSLVSSYTSTASPQPSTWNIESKNGEFWPSFAPLLAAAAPRVSPPELKESAPQDKLSETTTPDHLAQHLGWDDESLASFKGTHQWFLKQLRFNAPKIPYESGTRGIVTAAGGHYFPILLVTLRMLRRTGSTLPVEVFLQDKDEYEELACEILLKDLGAKCVILSELLGDFDLHFKFSGYQLKPFALLFSSFQETLFLDADDIPARDPEELFEMEIYKEKRMILWPDFWQPTTSPYFSEITGVSEKTFLERPTVEAGQIVVDKSTHANVLLLAAYYNTYGGGDDNFYYHLQSQGGAGEGDKETWAAAALVLKSPFYTVNEGPRFHGDSIVVLQFHPGEDWAARSSLHFEDAPKPSPFFIHMCAQEKLNAKDKFEDHRKWGSAEENVELFGEDLEPVARSQMIEIACDDEVQFNDWGDKRRVIDEESGEKVHICQGQRDTFKKMFGWDYELRNGWTYDYKKDGKKDEQSEAEQPEDQDNNAAKNDAAQNEAEHNEVEHEWTKVDQHEIEHNEIKIDERPPPEA